MAESKVNPENYITVQGWMIRDLMLKGNELLIYACIYGFSQAENQVYSGGLQYLADWTNSTKHGVMRALKSLVEKGLLEKTDKIINGVKFCEYRATKLHEVCNKVTQGMQQSYTGGMKQSYNNNISLDKKDNNKDIYIAVVEHLNMRLGTKYKPTTKETQKHINARVAEGFTVDDFKLVIDKKSAEWKGNKKMQVYLRPETLFGTKFESYLNSLDSTTRRNAQQPRQRCEADDLDGIL